MRAAIDLAPIEDLATEQAVHQHAAAVAGLLGYERYTVSSVIDAPASTRNVAATFLSVHNAPPAYIGQFCDPEIGRIDPVMQYVKHHGTPIAYSQNTYTRVGCGDLWEEQAPHGYASGITWAIHMPGGRHFLFGLDRRDPLPSDLAELQRHVDCVQRAAMAMCDSAFETLSRTSIGRCEALTASERTALSLILDGETLKTIPDRLRVSDAAASRLLGSAVQKLKVTNGVHAALRAYRLGLVG